MMSVGVTVRDWCDGDLAALHAINEGAVPGVGTLTLEALEKLVRRSSAATMVAEFEGRPAGFVLCMIEGLDYASLNYKWISSRFASFAYIDRVAVADGMRGAGVGEALYRHVFSRFAGKRDKLLAEVNLAPPNPGSLRFHKRLGFHEIGERWEIEGEKGVVYLQRAI